MKTKKKYLLVDSNGYGKYKYLLVDLKTLKVIQVENYLHYLNEDYDVNEVAFAIGEIN
jgi:hypothetical protein